MARKLVIEISIPSVPRFSNFSAVSSSWRRQVDQIASEKLYLFLSLILLVVSSLYTLSYHTVELAFINQHYAFRENRLVGFEVSFGTDVRKIAWLPVLFYCSPHHQLAIAAAYACIALSAVVCVFYLLAPRIKNVSIIHSPMPLKPSLTSPCLAALPPRHPCNLLHPHPRISHCGILLQLHRSRTRRARR